MAEKGQRVVLNSAQGAPIGAIIDVHRELGTPTLPEFTASTELDSVVKFEHTTAEQVAIRKKFFFQKSSENKDNYVIEMDVDLENQGNQAISKRWLFCGAGSTAPIHPKDYPTYTRLAWCIDGRAKGIDAGWFGSSGGFLGVVVSALHGRIIRRISRAGNGLR